MFADLRQLVQLTTTQLSVYGGESAAPYPATDASRRARRRPAPPGGAAGRQRGML